jgi:dipeptidase
MGINEKGVVIGNEALFTKVKPEKTSGLIGMDLLRLALERGANAGEAAQIIIDLLKTYGQAGPCGYRDKKFSYMNSFIIMDRQGIIKLETAGRDYALQRPGDYAVISNGITIAKNWNASSLEAGTDFS